MNSAASWGNILMNLRNNVISDVAPNISIATIVEI
jgi:hypothetical protein